MTLHQRDLNVCAFTGETQSFQPRIEKVLTNSARSVALHQHQLLDQNRWAGPGLFFGFEHVTFLPSRTVKSVQS